MSSPSITIDILIFTAFFLLNVIVGFRYRGKSRSFKEYAIGDKQFSTATLTATIVATWMSGSLLFIGLEKTYSSGLSYVIPAIVGGTVGLLLTGRVIGPRMGKFMQCVSVPDSLRMLYGKHVQWVSGISAVLSSIGYIALQFKVIARILSILLDYDGPEVTILASTIVILYSASGGIKAVTFTDIVQFFTFGTLLPVLALVIWNHLQDTGQIAHCLQHNELFSFKQFAGWTPNLSGMIALTCYLATPDLYPALFQRISMANSIAQVKRSMTYSAIICLGIRLCVVWVAILLLVDSPNMDPTKIVQYIVNTYTYPGLRGFLGIGIIALAMSTADSTLNSSAVIIANDVLPPLHIQKANPLKVAKIATLVLGMIALILALYVKDLLDILLLSANFYSPIVVIPMLLAVFGFQTSRRVVLTAMGAGAFTVTTCLIAFRSVNSFFPGMLANLIVMLGAHYLLNEEGGWGNNPLPENTHGPLKRKSWITTARDFKLYSYLARTLPNEDYFYSLFGFYVFTATYASFYLLPNATTERFPVLYGTMQYSVMVLFTTFLSFPIWPNVMKNKRLLSWFWPLCAFYALFLVGGTLVLLSGFADTQILIFMLNFVMAVLLLHWPIAIAMTIGGWLLILLAFSQYANLTYELGNLGTIQFRISYGLLLFSSFLIALFKHKQAYSALERHNKMLTTERKLNQEELVKALSHEARFFSEVTTAGDNVLEAVSKKVEKFSQQALTVSKPEQLTIVRHTLEEAHQALKDTMIYLRNAVYRVQGHLRLQVDIVPINNLIKKTLAVLKAQYTKTQPHIRHITKATQRLQCDATKIQQLLVNALLYAQQHNSTQQPVFLDIQETTLGYPIPSVKAYIKEVPALCITVNKNPILPQVKKLYMGTTGNTTYQVPQSMEDLPLLDNQHIVDAHYGAVEFIKEKETLTQVYVIPIHLREVRPSMMDLPQMEAGGLIDEANTVLPEETALLKRLLEETSVDMELAEKAIMYIKKYHGPMKRKSGEPFYLHPIAATDILLNYTEDQAAILATLLHDTVEDTPLTLAEIGVVFGPDVAAIVNKVTHLDGQFRRINMNTQENIRQLLEETDIRVLQVKIADRTHNMRTIEGHSSLEKQKRIAEETLHFFVPMAKHLGLKQIEEELQGLIVAVMKKNKAPNEAALSL
ncbi:MAG: sodium:solute symporter family protein [Bacteroidota bacterium]